VTIRRRLILELTRKEVELLCRGLRAGIGDDGIDNIGLSKREQYMLGRVGNRVLDLAGSVGPRYYESKP